MKKILFASTALVAAGLMTAGTASASEKIKLELGGYSKWWVVGAWQDASYERAQAGTTNNTTGGTSNVDIKGDNEIFIGGSTTLDNGMKVGINLELEAGGQADSSPTAANGGDVIDKSYVFVETGFGKFIVGAEANGTVLLHVMAPEAAGNWGADSILGQSIASPAGGNWGNTIVSTEIDTDDNAEKITYVAPTFYGLTVGGSYIPHAGDGTGDNPAVHFGSVPAYGVGALYARTFGSVDLKLSGGYVTYDISTGAAQNRDTEWSTGAQVSFAGFTLGGSYRDIQRDDAAGARANASDGNAWDAGIQYATGPYAVSFAYFRSEAEGSLADTDKDVLTRYQASGKYTLGAGVDALASIGYTKYEDEVAKTANNDRNHNEGWAVMTGLGLTF